MAFRESRVLSHLIELKARQRVYNHHMKQVRAAKTILSATQPDPVPRIRRHRERHALSLDLERQINRENTKQFNAIEQGRSEIGRNAVESLSPHSLHYRPKAREHRSDWLAMIAENSDNRNKRPKTMRNSYSGPPKQTWPLAC